MRFQLASLLWLAAAFSYGQSSPNPPDLIGYVTRFVSPADFDVNGRRILLDNHSSILIDHLPTQHSSSEYTDLQFPRFRLYIGEQAEVYGSYNRKNNSIKAFKICFHVVRPHEVAGTAVINAILPLPVGAQPGDTLIRADGFPILIAARTPATFDPPLSSPADIAANVFVTYKGTQGVDGIVRASKVSFRENKVRVGAYQLRQKWEYDPTAVSPDTHQDPIGVFIRGIDPRLVPTRADPELQAHLDKLGARLVPGYQTDLPGTEPTHIDFRFYLVDAPNWHDAMPLPNGIVLVPYQLVGRLQNDSQLATVLADKIAWLLEKQPIYLPSSYASAVAGLGISTAIAVIVPDLALGLGAAGLPLSIVANNSFYSNQQQRDRVTVELLHDAGFDIDQVPITWWRLSASPKKNIQKTPLPDRCQYLYRFLAETWSSNSAQSPGDAAALAAPAAHR